MRSQCGFSLVELVVFIVVVGIAISGVFLAFSTALQQSIVATPQTITNTLASGRMDIILGQKRSSGFNTFTDICMGAALCTLPAALSSYTVTSSINTLTISGDSHYKVITVTAAGPQNASTTLKTLVAEY